jgi:hypothetical protein
MMMTGREKDKMYEGAGKEVRNRRGRLKRRGAKADKGDTKRKNKSQDGDRRSKEM